MKTKFIFDTSAILTYFEDEEGSETIGNLIEQAEKNEILIIIPFIVQIELYYVNFKKSGEDIANQRFAYLINLPFTFNNQISESYLIQTGRIKAQYPISIADAMVAAYALLEEAVLVHKDSEFLSLENEIRLQTLPLK